MSEELTIEDLRDCKVAYNLNFERGREIGIGTFKVSGNPEHGTQILEIHQNYHAGGGTLVAADILVDQSLIPMIRLHPDQAVARFVLNIP
jgi:hypothetical protein